MKSDAGLTVLSSSERLELEALPSEQLERHITELGGHINAATARWLPLVPSARTPHDLMALRASSTG
jgi:hypothetical protein